MDIKQLLTRLTTEEKAALVAGRDFMFTNPVPGSGISSLRMSDGPHGLRVQDEGGDNGVTGSSPATAFPTAATVACGWDPENSYKIGRAIGREARKYGVNVVLGPGANIKRNPLAGRNFEYFSEDPLLSGKLAAQEVKGLQSKGVGACVKHFALNNAENYRFMGNSVADMRAIREIYLKVFEIIVRESRPAAMMCAYNMINGEYCSQNRWLLTEVLRREWGFEGAVMTDWGAMHDRIASLEAGLDLEMPGDTAICRKWITDGIASGELSEETLDAAVENVLKLVERYAKEYAEECDFEADDRLSAEVAKDCAVLMKNDGFLPLDEKEEVFVCGELFEKMRYQGAGSSMINPFRLTSPEKAFDEMGVKYVYARGYKENETTVTLKYIEEAKKRSEKYGKAVVFAGLTDYVESEGCDRENMKLPENQIALIESLIGAGKEVAVVLFGGSPVELPFEGRVKAILNMYLPGQSGGRACAELLFGRADPSGRLAETWPLKYEDVPFGSSFSKTEREVYKESVYVGYRYYTTAGKKVRFPFGYGLSYTKFDYSDMTTDTEGEDIRVSCEVVNSGCRDGAEVVQLYVKTPENNTFHPVRELRAFEKIRLKAGERRRVEFTVKKSDLKYYDTVLKNWAVESGDYEFEICRDCNSVVFSRRVKIRGEGGAKCPEDIMRAYRGAEFNGLDDEVFERAAGIKIPPISGLKPITLESRFSVFSKVGVIGRLLYSAVINVSVKEMKKAKKLPEGTERDNKIKGALFLKRVMESNSLMSMTMCAGKSFPYNFAQGFMFLANGKILKGIKCFCTEIKASALPKDKDREV